MAKKDILKEAIADAKAVREVALVNAKAALEEAFTPKLQNMLSAKLSEELDEGMYDEDEKDMDEGMGMYDEDEKDMDEGMGMYDEDEKDNVDEMMYDEDEKDSMDEEIDLEEILNELELEEDKSLQTEKKEDEEEVKEEREREDDSNEEVTEEFDLDALLEEINNLDKKPTRKNTPLKRGMARKGMKVSMNESKRITRKTPIKKRTIKRHSLQEANNGCKSVKQELQETKQTLSKIRSELNEVNLLNSKLLYVNRIFKQNELDDAQKLRVVETLDKAETTKEAKLIYETIKDSFSISEDALTQEIVKEIKSNVKKSSKKPIRENLGMASKATGVSRSKKIAPKRAIINESDNLVSRFQKLANIKINE